MQVTKRPLTGWEAKSTVADRRRIKETIDSLLPLAEVAVACQADAVAAVESLGAVLKYVTPKEKPPVGERETTA